MSDEEYSDDEIKRAEPKVVEYCPNCSFPPEFCEFSTKWDQCQKYLKDAHPDLLEKLTALRIASGKTETKEEPKVEPKPKKEKNDEEEGDDEDDEDFEEDEDDEEEVTSAPVAKSDKKEIILTVKERTRRKRITIVQGVETCGLKAKDVAKLFSKKFATSASDTKEGIQLNGELDHDIAEYLMEQYPEQVNESVFYTIIKGGMKRKFY